MEYRKSNPFGCGSGKRGYRVPFDITPSELDSKCNDSFKKRLQGGSEGMDDDYKSFLEYLTGSCEQRETVDIRAENDEDEEEGEGEGEGEEEVDPDYKMYFNRLIPHGKSYALNVHEGSGMLVLVKYHDVDDSDEYWDSPARRKLSKGRNDGEEMRGAKDLWYLQSKEYMEIRRDSRCLQVKERKSSLLEKVLKREFMNIESCDTEGCRKRRRVDWESKQMAEPHELRNGSSLRQACRESWNSAEGVLRSSVEKTRSNSVPEKELYEIGTDPHLRKSSNAAEREKIEVTTPSRKVNNKKKGESKRILKPTRETETRKSIAETEPRHEPASDFGTRRRPMNATEDLRNVEDTRMVQKQKIFRPDWGREKVPTVAEKKLRFEYLSSPQTSSKSRNAIKREQTEVTDHQRNTERNIKQSGRQNLRSNLEKERSNLLAKKKLRSETINHDSHGAKASPRQRFVGENDDTSKSQHDCETEDVEIDGSYQVFLNGIENEGECVVFVHGGKRVKYEDDYIGNDSDSEILMWDHDPCLYQDTGNPFVSTKVNISIDGGDSEKEVSLFRRKVMSILKRPYNGREYKDLFRDVKVRKPMEVHREMRRPKSVSVDRLGKSYLDHHPDLKRKIVEVRGDRPKVLNILRGFFFWLNNTCHEGKIFKPWRDASCLAVIPPSKEEKMQQLMKIPTPMVGKKKGKT